jgi:hypothetical protein
MSASAPPIGMRRPASAPMQAGGRGLQLVQGSAATAGLQSKGFGRVGGLSADQRHGAAQPVQPQELKQMQMSLLRSEIAFLLEGTRGAVRLQQLLERSSRLHCSCLRIRSLDTAVPQQAHCGSETIPTVRQCRYNAGQQQCI